MSAINDHLLYFFSIMLKHTVDTVFGFALSPLGNKHGPVYSNGNDITR